MDHCQNAALNIGVFWSSKRFECLVIFSGIWSFFPPAKWILGLLPYFLVGENKITGYNLSLILCAQVWNSWKTDVYIMHHCCSPLQEDLDLSVVMTSKYVLPQRHSWQVNRAMWRKLLQLLPMLYLFSRWSIAFYRIETDVTLYNH